MAGFPGVKRKVVRYLTCPYSRVFVQPDRIVYRRNGFVFGHSLLFPWATIAHFSGGEIRSVEVQDLGALVSVTIIPSVDADSTTLTLLLPRVNIVLQGPISSAPVVTNGIRTVHVGPFGPPFGHGQQEFYSIFPLSGTASHVLLE